MASTIVIILLHDAEEGEGHEGQEQSDGKIVIKLFQEAQEDQETHEIRANFETEAAAASLDPPIFEKAHDNMFCR